MFATVGFLVVAVLLIVAIGAAILFGKSILPEREGEELEVLKNFKISSQAKINRILYPEPFYGNQSAHKKRRGMHAV